MDILLVTLLAAVFVTGLGMLALLVLVTAGIRAEDRNMSLTLTPRTRAGSLARRLTGASVRRPQQPPHCPLRAREEVTVQTIRKIKLPGRHCQCGALRTGSDRRCEKCRARSGWYRHKCRRPRRAASGASQTGTSRATETRARGQRTAEES